MTLQPGVKLNGTGKTVVGDKVTVPNKLTISEYRKLQEPKHQQLRSTLNAMEQ